MYQEWNEKDSIAYMSTRPELYVEVPALSRLAFVVMIAEREHLTFLTGRGPLVGAYQN